MQVEHDSGVSDNDMESLHAGRTILELNAREGVLLSAGLYLVRDRCSKSQVRKSQYTVTQV